MEIQKAIEVLRAGGVIAHPTDTCYGFTCDVFNEDAIRRLYEIKGMPASKPVSMMIANVSDICRYAEVSEKAQELIDKHLPGALTLILPRKNLPGFFNPVDEFVGVRVPDHELCRELCSKFGGPLVTTSANLSGHRELYSPSEIKKILDFVIDAGELPQNKPSTIVKVVDDNIEILRQGDIKL